VSYACTQWLTKSRVLAPVFDDLACSYKNEGSIPFTRSTLFLSKFAVFPGTVIRVSYEAARISPVFRGFHSRNRNRGSGEGDLRRRGCDLIVAGRKSKVAQRPILNTQLVFLFASKITRSKERGFGLRWFTGTPLRLASASAMLRGIGALHRVSSGFGSKSGLRGGAPDLTGVGDVSVS